MTDLCKGRIIGAKFHKIRMKSDDTLTKVIYDHTYGNVLLSQFLRTSFYRPFKFMKKLLKYK